jgi:hypothetical protein
MKEINKSKELKVIIEEQNTFTKGRKVEVTVTGDSQGIYIKPKGYVDSSGSAPIILEVWENKLRLVIWNNILKEETTHIIDLEGAREDNPEFLRELDKQKADSMVFDFSCAWAKGKAKRTLGEVFNDKTSESLINIYGKDIFSECANAKIGQVVKWEEPFNGWVKAKRVK